ncbi:hypothetical protein pb186bvf_013135 [Paramecium bursaria]
MFRKNLIRLIQITTDDPAEQTVGGPILIIGTLGRIGLPYIGNTFGSKAIIDTKLDFTQDFLTWINWYKPLTEFDETIPDIIIDIFLAYNLVLLITYSTAFLNYKYRIARGFLEFNQKFYIDMILVPQIVLSFMCVNIVGHLVILIIVLLIQTLLQRNYSLPIHNELHRRPSIFNLFIFLSYSVLCFGFQYFNELGTNILLIINSLMLLYDAYFIRPLPKLEKIYKYSSAIYFSVCLSKLLSYQESQYNLLYDMMFFIILIYPAIGYILEILANRDSIMTSFRFLEMLDYLTIYKIANIQYQIAKSQLKGDNLKKLLQQFVKEYPNSQSILMVYIQYLYNSKEYTLAYIMIKKFQISAQRKYMYTLVFCELYIQMIQNHYNKEQGQEIQFQDIRQTDILVDKCLPQILQFMEEKDRYWQKLLMGYQKIEDLHLNTILLSKRIFLIKQLIFGTLKFKPLELSSYITQFNVIQLKLMSQVFSIVLNDYHSTFETENRIDEILQYERNQQTEEILNINLMNEDILIMFASILKNRGYIISSQRVTKFFNQEILYIDQLLPKYVKYEHEQYLENLYQNGDSYLFKKSKQIFYLQNRFIKCGRLKLAHIYEGDDDYLAVGVLQKINQDSDFIIFDANGLILNTSERISNYLFHEDQIPFINQCYIYYWFYKISEQIDANMEEVEDPENSLMFTQIVFKLKSLRIIQQENDNLIKRMASDNKQTLNSLDLDDTHEKSFTQFPIIRELHNIDKLLLNANQNQQFDLKEIYEIKYKIYLEFFGLKKTPLFIMKIIDINKINPHHKINFGKSLNLSNKSNIGSSQLFKTEVEQSFFEIYSEQGIEIQINNPIVNKNLNPIQLHYSFEDKSKSITNIISPRGNLENQWINQQEVQDIDNQLYQERDQQNYQEDIEQEKVFAQSSSEKVKNKLDLREVITNQLNAKNNVSISSGTSDRSQNSILSLIRYLHYQNKLQRRIVSLINSAFILFVVLLMLVVGLLVFMRLNYDNLVYQIPLVRIPDTFSRLMSSFLALGQLHLQQLILEDEISEFWQYRIKSDGKLRRADMTEVVQNVIDQFSIFDQQGKLPLFQVDFVTQYDITQQNISFIQFDALGNDQTYFLNEYFQNTDYHGILERLIEVYYIKANLEVQLQMSNELVNSIADEFFNKISTYQLFYLVFLLLMVTFILIVVSIQFQYIRNPYQYMQGILLVISRINDRELDIMIQKQIIIKDKIIDNQKWKQTNYFKEIFMVRQHKQEVVKQSQKVIKNKVNTRVQETQFSLFRVVIILVFLWFMLNACVISAYIYQTLIMEQSQPELQLCMSFIRFKNTFDSLIITAYLLKNEPVILDKVNQLGIFDQNDDWDNLQIQLRNQIITRFKASYTRSIQEYQNIYRDIEASSKISGENKHILVQIYQLDICELDFLEESIPYCHYDGEFEHFLDYPIPDDVENEDYKERLKYGINGIIQQQIFNIIRVHTTLSSYYNKELNGEWETDLDALRQFMHTPDYVQLFQFFFLDVNKPFLAFLSTIITAPENILESDFQNVQIYYIVFGTIVSMILFIIIAFLSISLQFQVKSIRQSLVLVPHEALLDPLIGSSIKRLERQS